jgi:hypothetical protein
VKKNLHCYQKHQVEPYLSYGEQFQINASQDSKNLLLCLEHAHLQRLQSLSPYNVWSEQAYCKFKVLSTKVARLAAIIQGYSARATFDEEDEDQQVYTMVDEPDNDIGKPEIPASSDTAPQREHHQVHVEEVPDSDAPMRRASDDMRWIDPYPVDMLAGTPMGDLAVAIPTKFDNIRHQLESNGDKGVWGPFKDEEEWQLAKWLIQNVGQNQTDKFLKLPIVSHIEFQRFPFHTHLTKIQS